MCLYGQSLFFIEDQDYVAILQAASLRIAEQYMQAFSKIAKEVKKLSYQVLCANKVLSY